MSVWVQTLNSNGEIVCRFAAVGTTVPCDESTGQGIEALCVADLSIIWWGMQEGGAWSTMQFRVCTKQKTIGGMGGGHMLAETPPLLLCCRYAGYNLGMNAVHESGHW